MGKSNKLSMGHYFKKELLLFFVSFYSVSLSQTYSIRTVDERITDHYVQVISMSQGSVEEITSGLNDTTTERSYRIIIVGRSVLKNEFQGNNVYFEEFISGPEGCCKRLVRSRKVDLFGLLSAFKISSEALRTGIPRDLSSLNYVIKGSGSVISIEKSQHFL